MTMINTKCNNIYNCYNKIYKIIKLFLKYLMTKFMKYKMN